MTGRHGSCSVRRIVKLDETPSDLLFEDLQHELKRERAARRAAEAAARLEERNLLLAETEERLRRIIDSIADAVVVVDRDGVVKFANPAAGKLFGRSREEVVGDPFGLPLVTGETIEVDVREGRVAEMRAAELPWDGDVAWLASLRDVTARREAEQSARRLWRERTAREEAEKERVRLEELLARAPAAILTTRGRDHVCAFANPGMARLVGGRELGGRPLGEALPELAGQGFFEGFDAAFVTGADQSRTELRLAVAGGERGPAERFLDVTWEPLRSDGSVDGVLCFAYDVTEQVATRRRLESVMERLRAEERAKDQFLAVLGHELRNPLAGIDSGLRLLELGAEGERAAWSMGMMRKQVGLLTRLLDDLLDVSAVARGKLELDRQAVPLAELVESAVAAVEGRFEERGQRLEVALPDPASGAEPLAVEADPRRLAQVLANLLVNASKYSDAGAAIALEARREGTDAVIEVSDPGSGIEPEMLDEIFEPFFQAGNGSPQAGGLGIGLTLVRQLVELHGGTVEAASAGAGRGSTFTVRLPAARAGAAAAVAIPAESHPPRRDRVLVVDDNEDAALALGELLELRGCRVATAASGDAGIAEARRMRPDAVLLDLDLPDMPGFEVAERLRAESWAQPLLIVAVSGYGDEEARQRSRASGIDHHLVKPVELDRLMGLFAEHAARAAAGG